MRFALGSVLGDETSTEFSRTSEHRSSMVSRNYEIKDYSFPEFIIDFVAFLLLKWLGIKGDLNQGC
jgi:hypothetical protein